MVKDRDEFAAMLDEAFEGADLSLDAPIRNALLSPGSLGEKDPTAAPCLDSKGNPEPDADLRDTENVPLPPDISLPLPLDYKGKGKSKSAKPDASELLELVRDHCEAYLEKEVLPFRAHRRSFWSLKGAIRCGDWTRR